MSKKRTDRLAETIEALEVAVNGLQMLALDNLAFEDAFYEAAEILAFLEALRDDKQLLASKTLQ